MLCCNMVPSLFMIRYTTKRSALGSSLSLSVLKARERANPIQINTEVSPEETEPSEPCNRITPDEYREEPELLAVVQPNVCVAEHAASDSAGVDSICGGLHLRYELRWRSCRRLNASGCTPWKTRPSWPSRSTWSAWKPSTRSWHWKKPHM